MNNKPIKPKISILSTDEATLKLLGADYLSKSFISEVLPNTTLLESLLSSTADILILDDQNPLQISAIDICKIIRTKNEEVVIIILATEFDLTTKVLALEFGADDYLEKPANRLEVMARIKVTLKRINSGEKAALSSTEYRVNDLYLDASRRICVANGHELNLTNYEFLTLFQLVQSNGKPVSRTSLLSDIWGLEREDTARPVDNVIRRLRKKLKAGQSPTQITSVWGHGYRIET